MQSSECLHEIDEEMKETAKTIDKHEWRKHWDQVYEQYQLNNYLYIDSQGILHEDTLQYVDNYGQVHYSQMHFLDADGIVHQQPDAPEEAFEPQSVECKYKCYCELSPWRKRPNVKRAKKYFLKKKLSYTAAKQAPTSYVNYDEHAEISRLLKKVSDQITENVWKQKECIDYKSTFSLEHAFVATSKNGNPLEISMTESDAEHDNGSTKASSDNTHDMVNKAKSITNSKCSSSLWLWRMNVIFIEKKW